MKNLLVMVALTFGLVSGAEAHNRVDENSTWDEIARSSRVYYEMPQFALSHGFFVRARGVCVDGEVLRTIKKKRKCVDYRGRNDRCVKWIDVYPSKPMEGTRRVCTRWQGGDNERCTRYEDFPYSIETSYDIEVSRLRRMGDGDEGPGRYLFTKNFTIPSCN
jgi:hypothetical protein